jgi:hypothetical protein
MSRGWLRKQFYKITQRGQLWAQSKSEVARFEGIIISDPGRSDNFRATILAALQLVKDADSRRFKRVVKHLKWIVNCTLDEPCAAYLHDTKTCTIDFKEPGSDEHLEFNAAYYAKTLVHEATHGVVSSRGVHYTPEVRSRIEKLCVTEENRFVDRLSLTQPELTKGLHRKYDESAWNHAWKRTRIGFFWRMIYRLFKK